MNEKSAGQDTDDVLLKWVKAFKDIVCIEVTCCQLVFYVTCICQH